jgi:hypothetical protein
MLTLGLTAFGLSCLAIGLRRWHRLNALEALLERRVNGDFSHWVGGLRR